MYEYLRLFRIDHVVKNLLIFAPLFFSRQFLDREMFFRTLGGFIAFSFMTFVIYIFNDIRDVENDRLHPVKCHRPIASGRISIPQAYAAAAVCLLIAVFLLIRISCFVWLAVYVAVNILYSLGLKKIPLLDIVILVSGFLLRILYGGALCGAVISDWLYLTVVSGAFFLGFGKRRNEMKNKTNTREVLKKYSYDFLDKNMYLFMALLNVFYALWALDCPYPHMIWTVLFVMVISLKYSMNLEGDTGENPVEIILHDKVILLLGLSWTVLVFFQVYLHF